MVGTAEPATTERAIGWPAHVDGEWTVDMIWQPDLRTSPEPDLLVVRKDRIGPKNITETPSLVIEVLSPGSARIDRRLKSSRYAEGGIAQYWIVDPRAPSVEVYDLAEGEYRLTAQGRDDDAVTVVAPLSLSVVPRDLVSD